jgi:hypothetical protein
MHDYKHTQMAGWPVLIPTGLAVMVSTVIGFTLESIFGIALAIILIFLLALFYSLTVAVDDSHITLSYGIGLIRIRIPLSRILAVERVRNKWFHGWGIRWIPGGRLYNVSGLQAVELVMVDDTRIRIGTDEPFKLSGAVYQRIMGRRRRFEV